VAALAVTNKGEYAIGNRDKDEYRVILTCSSGLHEQQSIFIAYSLSAKWRAPFV
jgi:hypothetical protein